MDPPASKRYREITLLESAATTPRLSDSPLRLLQMVDKRLDNRNEELQKDLQNQLRELFQESETRLLNKLEERLCERLGEMRSDLDDVRDRVMKLETEMEKNKISTDKKLEELKTELAVVSNKADKVATVSCEDIELKTELHDLRRKIMQQENTAVACDLRIDGIPYYNNENTYNIFCAICSSLNIETLNVRAIYRLNNNKKFSITPTILVKLFSPYEKNYFLKSVSNYRRRSKDLLRLTLINFESNEPFYINENLSLTNYKIFNKCLKLKKEKSIFSVFTIRGIVHVIKEESGQPIRIEYFSDLNDLFRANASEDILP